MGNSESLCKSPEIIEISKRNTHDLSNCSTISDPSPLCVAKIIKIQTKVRSLIASKKLKATFSGHIDNFLLASKFHYILLSNRKFYSFLSSSASDKLKELGSFKFKKSKKNSFVYCIEKEAVEIFDNKNHYCYKGSWNFSYKRHGYGALISDGELNEGEWIENVFTGNGRIIFSDGSYYEGQFKDNQYSGTGKLFRMNASSYEGQWLNCLPHGKGIEKFKDGSTFSGFFEEGLKVKGTYFEVKGKELDGNFVKNKFVEGKVTWSDGKVFEGFWNDQLNFQGVRFTWPDGCFYQGDYRDGRKEGKGRYVWTDGEYIGNFMKGLKHGKGMMRKRNMRFKGDWRFGRLITVLQNLEGSVERSSLNEIAMNEECWQDIIMEINDDCPLVEEKIEEIEVKEVKKIDILETKQRRRKRISINSDITEKPIFLRALEGNNEERRNKSHIKKVSLLDFPDLDFLSLVKDVLIDSEVKKPEGVSKLN